MPGSESGSEVGSQSASSFGENSSVAESADSRVQREAQDRNDEAADLLEQNRNFEETVFASLYSLSQNRKGDDIRWTVLRVVLEFLQLFRVVFNTRTVWSINQNLWVWKPVYWILYRVLVIPKGYSMFIGVMYGLAGVIFMSLILLVWVALVTRKDARASPWIQKLAAVLQFVMLVVYSVGWVSVMDYLTFLFNCDWRNYNTARGPVHMSFPSHSCMAMPHLAHMIFAFVVLVVFVFATLCVSVCDCELNPLTRNHLASAVAVTNIRTMGLKILMVVLSTTCAEMGAAQSVLMLLSAVWVAYSIYTTVPYYHDWMNYTWVGLWFGIVYTTGLLVFIEYTIGKQADRVHYAAEMTWCVLYGIFPAVLLGVVASYVYVRYKRRPLQKLAAAFEQQHDGLLLKSVYRFKDVTEAEFLIRVMRKWDEDEVPDADATAFAQFILKCALARFPNQPMLMTLYSNLTFELLKDGIRSRTQLQLAIKNKPTLVERYFIYMSQETIKRLKTDAEGMDLVGYVEFQRSYRVCVRAHKTALQAQRQLWHCVLRDNVSYRELQSCFDLIDKTEKQAMSIYRRAMERYPNNGKLLKVYGRFLEYVHNDPWKAGRYYSEAMKIGTEQSLLSLASASAEGDVVGTFQGAKANAELGVVDEKSDAIVIINSGGIMLMINSAASRLFGYAKGELDGKNVSILMPQPFAGRHNGWVNRCAMTGKSRILGSLRQVVGLHKDRSIFPLSLFIQRLSGVGADTIFMGIMRPTHTQVDINVVRLWVTPAGIILCTSDKFRDWFGMPSTDVVGTTVNSLCTDAEAFDRYMNAVMDAPRLSQAGSNGLPPVRVSLVHRYLAPIDAELTMDYGGSDDNPIYIVNFKCFADTLAMMVADGKGRIEFGTTQLAAMVGYNVKNMTEGMNISMLMPPPYSQLHTAYLKDLNRKPTFTSCRAGAVVHLMHAKNKKIPVTLQLSRHDDGDHIKHIIKVLPATDAQLLDQQRIELQLSHKGMVLGVNPGAKKEIFNLNPADLIGRPLASFINVFTEWRHKFGEDESLLALLGVRAEQGLDVIYRVGVHSPFTDQELLDGEVEAVSGTGGTAGASKGKLTLIGALKARHRAKPAIMTLSMAHDGEEAAALIAEKVNLDSTVMLTMSLWRTEGLSAMVETNAQLGIIRAEPQAGLVFGVPHTSLVRKSYRSLAGLPPGTDGNELLFGSGKKKSIVKQGGAGWKTGPLKVVECTHMDGGTMKMQVQAISKDGKTANRLLIMSRLVESDLGSLKPLLALKGQESGDGHNLSEMLTNQEHGSDSDTDEARRQRTRKRTDSLDSTELHDKLDSRLRIEQWVDGVDRQDSKQYSRENSKQIQDEPETPSGAKRNSKLRFAKMDSQGRRQSSDHDAQAHVSVTLPNKQLNKVGSQSDKSFTEAAATLDKANSSASSDSQSASGNELQDANSDASGVDEELLVDWRRAKRLKKLRRMMTGSGAQVASERFRKLTYLVMLVFVAAHVACFGVLMTNINGRYQTTQQVGDVAVGIQQNQMIAVCSNYVHKCYHPDYAAMDICSTSSVQSTLAQLAYSYNEFKTVHQGLYLGYTKLRSFRDNRLADYWTTTKIPEYVWFPNLGNQPEVTVTTNNTLWEMGNKYLLAERDVLFNQAQLKYSLDKTTYFQYIYQNGPVSLFLGYVWTLDVFVDFAWAQFGSLKITLVILLALEAVVQVAGMIYEFILLKAANSEAMKRCSVLLALPSATVRGVASRQLQVDDDDESDVDEDEMDAINAAAGGTAAPGTAADQPDANAKPTDGKPKTVRLADPGTEDDEDAKKAIKVAKDKLPTSSGRTKARGRDKSSVDKQPKTLLQKINFFLFGWADSTFKVNAKKLMPHNVMLWRFMTSLLVWMSGVIIVFGVSYLRLADLQAPLASLNAAAHVTFRVARVRMVANVYAFAFGPVDIDKARNDLLFELSLLRKDYDALLYGGSIDTIAKNLKFNAYSPAAAFSNKEFSDIFFKTTDCLRIDKSLCFTEGSPWYDVTHSGLDAMVVRFIEQMTEYANVPDEMSYPNYTSYEYLTNVAANDMYDGLQTASQLFEHYMIGKFEQVKRLHIITLVCTLVLCFVFLWKLFRPYVAELRVQSKAMAGVLSQLPAEVDIEGHVKQLVLGWSKEAAGPNKQAPASVVPPGVLAPGAVPAAAPGAAGGWRNSLTNLLPGVANGAMVPAGAMMPAGMMPSGAFMMMPAQGGMPAMFFQPQQVKQDPEAASLDDENRTGSEDNI